MKTFTYTIKDEFGMHARPAGLLAKEAKTFSSTIMIDNGQKKVNAGKLIALMSMGIRKGDTVTVSIEGADEDLCLAHIRKFFEKNL